MSLIRILESDNWIVDYESGDNTYRVSYFEDGHFVSSCKFHKFNEFKAFKFYDDEVEDCL